MIVKILAFNTATLATPKQARQSFKSLLFNTRQEQGAPDIVVLALQEVAWFDDRSRLDTGLLPPPTMYARFLQFLPRLMVPLVESIIWLYFTWELMLFWMLKLIFPDHTSLPGKFLYQLFVPLTNASLCADSYICQWKNMLIDVLHSEHDKDPQFDMEWVVYGSNALILLHRKAIELKIISRNAVGFGFMELPNKGAVSIRTLYKNRIIDFIGVHLTANEGFYLKRNQDFLKSLSSLQDSPAHATTFVGDMNYRLNISRQDYENRFGFEWLDINEGFALDELSLARETHHVISKFEEGKVDFPASYKLKSSAPIAKIGNRFNLSSYFFEKRLPAWCDRIIYHNVNGVTVQSLDYCNNLIYAGSDHLPVGATLEIESTPADSKPEALIKYRSWTTIQQVFTFMFTIFLVQMYRASKVFAVLFPIYLIHAWFTTESLVDICILP